MQTICLRPPWVWRREPKENCFSTGQLRTEYPKWYKNLWAYISCCLTLRKRFRQCVDLPNFRSTTRISSVRRKPGSMSNPGNSSPGFSQRTGQISESIAGRASLISCEKAKKGIWFFSTLFVAGYHPLKLAGSKEHDHEAKSLF